MTKKNCGMNNKQEQERGFIYEWNNIKDVLEKLENAIELEDWTIVQELLNDIEMELEYANPFDQYEDEEDLH